MQFDLGNKGLLKIIFYEENHRHDFSSQQFTLGGTLCGKIGDNLVSVRHEGSEPADFIPSISRKFFETAFPFHDFGVFHRASHGGLSVIVGGFGGNVYETSLSDTVPPLQRHMDCLAKVVRGERRQGRKFMG